MGHAGICTRVLLLLAFSLAAIAEWPNIALAAQSDHDGVYGRLDGDISLSPSVGIAQFRGKTEPLLGFQAMYVSTLGLAFSHANTRFTFGADTAERSTTAIEFRLCPLFLGRWAEALEVGPPMLDLALDSFTIGLGAFWDYNQRLGTLQRGTSLSTGLSLPFFRQMMGPWLNAMFGLRFADGPAFSARTDAVAGLSVSWTWLVDSKIHADDR